MTATPTSLAIPYGRYVGASVQYDGVKQVKISGNRVTTTGGGSLVGLYLVMDLYNSVNIDGVLGALDDHAYTLPILLIGKPGAAIHMTTNGPGAELSFIFDAQGVLMAAQSNASGAGSFCTGNGYASDVTAGPSGVTIPTAGPSGHNQMMVSSTDSTGTGKIRYVAAGPNPSAAGGQRGIQVVTGWKQPVDQTVTIQCVADSAVTPAGLGFTYPYGTGSAGAPVTATIVRIIDPANILGTCTSGSPGLVAGSSGVCASPIIATSGDHYF